MLQVKDEVYIHSLATGEKLKRLEASHVGSMQVSGKRKQNWAFLTLTGFTTPGTVSKYEFKDEEKSDAGSSTVWRQTVVKGLAGSGGFTAEQVSTSWFSAGVGPAINHFSPFYCCSDLVREQGRNKSPYVCCPP